MKSVCFVVLTLLHLIPITPGGHHIASLPLETTTPEYAQIVGHAFSRFENKLRLRLTFRKSIPSTIDDRFAVEIFFADRRKVLGSPNGAALIYFGPQMRRASLAKILSNQEGALWMPGKALRPASYSVVDGDIILEFPPKIAEWWIVTDIVTRWQPKKDIVSDLFSQTASVWSIDAGSAMSEEPSFLALIESGE